MADPVVPIRSFVFAFLGALLTAGCAAGGDRFSEGLRVMSGKGGTHEQIDTFPKISEQVRGILKTHPAPDWQLKFRADAADVFELLPGNRLLLGEVQVSTAIAEPEYGDIALYDLDNGRRLWTAKRRDLEWGRYDLLGQEGDLILLQGSSPQGGFYTALNRNSGEVAWEYRITTSMHSTYAADEHRFHLLNATADKSELLSLDARTGRVTSRQALRGVTPASSILLIPQRKSLFVLAGAVYKLDTVRGSVDWRSPLPAGFDGGKALNMRVTDHGVLLWDSRHMALLSSQTGNTVWGPVSPGKPRGGTSYETIKLLSVPVASTGIFVWVSTDKIANLDLRSGVKRWEYKFDSKDGTSLQSPIFVANGKVYFTTYNSLTVLDAKAGRRLARQTFPFLESGLFSSLTPDIFVIRSDKVFLLREGGAVYAISAKTNELLWKQVVNWDYEMFFNTTQINADLKKSLTDKAYTERMAQQTSLWWSAHVGAMEHQSRYYTAMGQRKSSSSSDYGQIGSRGLIDTRGFDASMLFFQASLGLSDTIEKSIKASAQEGLAERLNMELNNATRNHMRSVQQGYFIRPYDSPKGMVLMLVHLDSGERYDLLYSPTNIGMRYIDMRLPAFIIDPGGKSLYTTEIGTDTSQYEKYVKFKHGMPYPSILRYRLKDMKFAH